MEQAVAKSILLVEDQQNVLTVLAMELRNCSNKFCVLTAENGDRALKVLESAYVDLVVTDLKMAVMDGFDLIAHMKREYPTIPVIVISSFLSPESEARLRALGVSQYIDKHCFSVSTLEEMILKNWQGV